MLRLGYEWVTAPGLGDAGRVVVVCVRLCGGDRTIYIGQPIADRKAVYPMGLPVNTNFFRLTSCCIGRRVCVYEPYRRRISRVRTVSRLRRHNRSPHGRPPARAPHRLAPPATALLAYRRHHIRATVLSRHRVARVPRRHPSARGAAPPRGIIRTTERRPLLGHTRWCGHGCGAGQRGTWSWHSLVEKLTSARS